MALRRQSNEADGFNMDGSLNMARGFHMSGREPSFNRCSTENLEDGVTNELHNGLMTEKYLLLQAELDMGQLWKSF
jgi:hypothetical protein